jgi:prepilin-type N-terminal cleavage/methylation domain-containing protein
MTKGLPQNTKYQMLSTNSGYTLIEILIALTIVGLIFGIGYVNFRDFSRRQALAGTVRKIKGDLRVAQENATSGQKPADPNCVGPTNPLLDGYNFTVPSEPHTYVIQAVCSGGTVDVKTIQVSSDIDISMSQNPILFKILGQGTNIVTLASITLTQTGTNSPAVITVSSGGEIK